MTASINVRRFVTLLALTVALAVRPASAKHRTCADFNASGTSTFQSADKHRYHLTIAGETEPTGAFTGTVDGKFVGPGTRETGTITLDFGGGDTLVISQDVDVVPGTQTLAGTYVIKRGTGTLKGAAGSGTITVGPPHEEDGTLRDFEMTGTLCQ